MKLDLTALTEHSKSLVKTLGWTWTAALGLIMAVVLFYALTGFVNWWNYRSVQAEVRLEQQNAANARKRAEEFEKQAERLQGEIKTYAETTRKATEEKQQIARQYAELKQASASVISEVEKIRKRDLRLDGNLDKRLGDLRTELDGLDR